MLTACQHEVIAGQFKHRLEINAFQFCHAFSSLVWWKLYCILTGNSSTDVSVSVSYRICKVRNQSDVCQKVSIWRKSYLHSYCGIFSVYNKMYSAPKYLLVGKSIFYHCLWWIQLLILKIMYAVPYWFTYEMWKKVNGNMKIEIVPFNWKNHNIDEINVIELLEKMFVGLFLIKLVKYLSKWRNVQEF